jgi:hypothetical protein
MFLVVRSVRYVERERLLKLRATRSDAPAIKKSLSEEEKD